MKNRMQSFVNRGNNLIEKGKTEAAIKMLFRVRLLFQKNCKCDTAICYIGCGYAGNCASLFGRSD